MICVTVVGILCVYVDSRVRRYQRHLEQVSMLDERGHPVSRPSSFWEILVGFEAGKIEVVFLSEPLVHGSDKVNNHAALRQEIEAIMQEVKTLESLETIVFQRFSVTVATNEEWDSLMTSAYGDDCLDVLCEMTNLRRIEFTNPTRFTEAGIERRARQLPNCEIVFSTPPSNMSHGTLADVVSRVRGEQ